MQLNDIRKSLENVAQAKEPITNESRYSNRDVYVSIKTEKGAIFGSIRGVVIENATSMDSNTYGRSEERVIIAAEEI